MLVLLSCTVLLFTQKCFASIPVQDPNDLVLDGCYTEPPSNDGILNTVRYGTTPNGYTEAARGWTSYGCQATPGACPGYSTFDQAFVLEQCKVLAESGFAAAGYDLCCLDAGWNTAATDKYGRTIYNNATFAFPELGNHLHSLDLKLGVYFAPGFNCGAMNKTIKGTQTTLYEVWDGNYDNISLCNFDYSKPAVQKWHDSQVELFHEYGIDLLKLDYVTPGSPSNGANLPSNTSAAAIAYHNAIINTGHQMRLDLSWKLCRNDTYFQIWDKTADSIRTDQDVNNYGQSTFVALQEVQRAIDNARQFVALQTFKNQLITVRPDMDDLFVANPQNITGITDEQRITVMSFWLGFGSNLILGSNLTDIDALGKKLLTSAESRAATAFCNVYPISPRNPSTGDNLAMQLSGWIGGPSPAGQAVVILANLGANLGEAGYNTTLTGVQKVSISLKDLGIDHRPCYVVKDIWNGNSSIVHQGGSLTAYLDEGNSQFLNLTVCN
ncbi:Melibiase 3 [Hyphodiscus hymeniophilus]|uniref:alpha-galactosidase n=1 Tax=Hyphodiscus hymeniophilus TaxID=353542 RepID=A0A9P6VT38_9HELO|nr:Melibiase 3 [Hyphodiscus hymeniophilus]